MSADDLQKLSDLLLAFSNEDATKGERIAIKGTSNRFPILFIKEVWSNLNYRR